MKLYRPGKSTQKNISIAGVETMPGRYLRRLCEEKNVSLASPTLFITGVSSPESCGKLLGEYGSDTGENATPECIVYLSSHKVYSPDAGKDVDETRPTFAADDEGRAYARTESWLESWCERRNVTLTVLRPAWMFGEGVEGEMLRLFNRVIRGHYVHVRGNDAAMSAVTALDTAEAMVAIAGKPGIFNLSDGRTHTWLGLCEAMTCNAGAQKRMTHLPEKWIKGIYHWFGRIPIVKETMSPEALKPLSQTLVLDNSRLAEATGIKFHDTLDVIARRDKTYPYENS